MSILNKIFGSKSVTITSEAIRGEIARAEGEIVTLHSKLAAARSGIMFLSDSEHQAVEADGAATERAIKRLDARIAHLNDELPKVVAAEEAAQAAAKDDALRQRADAARKANTIESKKLLIELDRLSAQMGDVLARLNEIADETNSVNSALRSNPVADNIVGFETLYRKHPAGHYELPLSAIVLPPAFSGGTARWPRSS